MYWTDAQRGVIETSRLDGSERLVLIDERRSTLSNNKSSVVRPHYYGIALDQRYIYYTDWSRGSVSFLFCKSFPYILLRRFCFNRTRSRGIGNSFTI